MDFVPQAIHGYDLALWVIGIYALRQFTKPTLSRGECNRMTGVNSSDRGKDWLGLGGHTTKGNGRGRVVCSQDINAAYRGRFTNRQGFIDSWRSAQAVVDFARYLSPDRAEVRSLWHQEVKQAAAELEAGNFTTGTAAGLGDALPMKPLRKPYKKTWPREKQAHRATRRTKHITVKEV